MPRGRRVNPNSQRQQKLRSNASKNRQISIHIDDSVIQKYVGIFGSEEFIKKEKGALNRAMQPLEDVAKQNLAKVTNPNGRGYGSATNGDGKRKRNPRTLEEGIRKRTMTNGTVGVIVSITNKDNQGNWLLPIFDQGTVPRYRGQGRLKKKEAKSQYKTGNRKGYTGVIKKSNFFKKAIDQTMNNFNQRFQKEMDKGLKELMDDIQ
jgi:hypothetical protein